MLLKPKRGGSVRSRVVLGEAIAAGRLFVFDDSNEAVIASAVLASSRYFVAGVTTSSGALGATVSAETLFGRTVAVEFAAAPPSSSNGDPVFLDDSGSGLAVLTPPDVSTAGRVRFLVGILRGADGATTTPSVLFQPRFITYRP